LPGPFESGDESGDTVLDDSEEESARLAALESSRPARTSALGRSHPRFHQLPRAQSQPTPPILPTHPGQPPNNSSSYGSNQEADALAEKFRVYYEENQPSFALVSGGTRSSDDSSSSSSSDDEPDKSINSPPNHGDGGAGGYVHP
jgi:hypothetical protein